MTTPDIPSCLVSIGGNLYQCSKHGWIISVTALPVTCSCSQDAPKPAPRPVVQRPAITPEAQQAIRRLADNRAICKGCFERPEGCWKAIDYGCTCEYQREGAKAAKDGTCPLGKLATGY